MGLLLMLATILGVIGAAVLIIGSSIKQVYALTKLVFGAVVVWFGLYFALLLYTSQTSKERTLNFNEPKAFCGFYLDCHLHAAVTDVKQIKTIGDGANQKTAQGIFYIVTVKVFSDAKRAELGLVTPRARVIDAEGKGFERETEAEKVLEIINSNAVPFDKQLGPRGELFTKEIVFDLPSDVKNPKLDFTQGHVIDRVIELFLIGDEDSLFHKPVRFSLEPQKSFESRVLSGSY